MKVVTPLVGVQIPLNIREPALGRNTLGVVSGWSAVLVQPLLRPESPHSG